MKGCKFLLDFIFIFIANKNFSQANKNNFFMIFDGHHKQERKFMNDENVRNLREKKQKKRRKIVHFSLPCLAPFEHSIMKKLL